MFHVDFYEDFHASKINMNIDFTVWEGSFYPYQRSVEPQRYRTREYIQILHDNNNQTNLNTFVTELDPVLSSLTNNRGDFLIAGDFNINLL